ncbi:MAG: respiratory nitrate reductase subunit gamma [Firmicutes bacterium]|nr:respiratory nitrate reductase subunit gamma [Bacillota bacterium]
MSELFWFVAFPYLAVGLAVAVGIYRFVTARFTYSSLSSQFLESTALFWGSVPWHYAILLILGAHLVGWLFPQLWVDLLSGNRTYAIEVVGVGLSLLAIFGLGALLARRLLSARVRAVSTPMDVVLLVLLLAQVVLGAAIAILYRFGGLWYPATAGAWLWSLATLSPNVQAVSALPLLVKLHCVGGFVLVALFPFTRLVHLVSAPIGYLWRPYQLVVWYRRWGRP